MLKTVGGPRGLLRIYVLHELSKKPMSGYDVISALDMITGGAWRPGSGSVYPLLEDLKQRKLIKVVSKGPRSRLVYSLTDEGRQVFEFQKEMINHFALRFNRIRMAIFNIMNPKTATELVLETQKMNRRLFENAMESNKIAKQEKSVKLKEYQLQLESDLTWARRELKRLR